MGIFDCRFSSDHFDCLCYRSVLEFTPNMGKSYYTDSIGGNDQHRSGEIKVLN